MSSIVFKQSYRQKGVSSAAGLNVRHLQYIATRPGAVYNQGCGFGLWGQLPGDDTARIQNDLELAKRIVRESSNDHTLQRAVISVGKQDAEKYGLYHREKWEKLVNDHIGIMAKEMDIKPDSFCWLASFHCAKGHPHVHLLYWDNAVGPRRDFFPKEIFKKKAERIRAEFAKDIYREEIRDTQQEQRSQTKLLRTALQAMCMEANPEKMLDIPRLYKNELLEGLSADMAELIRQLPAKGSLRYGYLPPEYKELVHSFIDKCLEQPELQQELGKFERLTNTISKLYANGEEGTAANLENAKKKLYKELGNEVMDAIRSIRDELPPKSRTITHTSERTPDEAAGDSFRNTLGSILPKLDSYQKLLSLLPTERIPLDHMDAQIPGYREQLSLVVTDVLSDARVRTYLQNRSPEAPAGEPFTNSGGTVVTTGKWEDVEERILEELECLYSRKLPEQTMRNTSSISHANSNGQGEKQNWWTNEYIEARRFFYGTKEQPVDLEKALTLMQAEAKKGNGFAMHDLGKMYLSGLGCEKNQERAQACFRDAFNAFLKVEATAEKKDYFQYRIGKLYAFGYGVEQDYSQAAAWYEKAVSTDNPFAAYSLGSLYGRGQGVQQDRVKAYGLYLMAAEHSKKPNAYAAYELGRMYNDGIDTVPDKAASDSWYRRAYEGFLAIESSMADDRLYYRLGQMNLNGIGTEVDLILAKQYFEKAARLNNSDALYGLGQLYLQKDSEDYDPGKAVGYLTDAAEKGHDYAQYTLGKLFLQGEAVSKDIDTALQWLEEAVGNENNHAEYLLGKLLLTGEDVEQDLPRAEELLKKAADSGNTQAQYTLGKAYLYGDLLEQNVNEGMRWLEKAANSGNEYARNAIEKYIEYQARKDVEWEKEAVRTCTASSLMGMMGILSRMVSQKQSTASLAALKRLQSKDKSKEAQKDAKAKQIFTSEWESEI